jgi:2-oxoglutarate dehydrogenase E2 component (dihydrolipoamide succinyltransferase)
MARRRAAPAGRVLATGLGVSATLGMIAAMAGQSSGVATVDPVAVDPASVGVPTVVEGADAGMAAVPEPVAATPAPAPPAAPNAVAAPAPAPVAAGPGPAPSAPAPTVAPAPAPAPSAPAPTVPKCSGSKCP